MNEIKKDTTNQDYAEQILKILIENRQLEYERAYVICGMASWLCMEEMIGSEFVEEDIISDEELDKKPEVVTDEKTA